MSKRRVITVYCGSGDVLAVTNALKAAKGSRDIWWFIEDPEAGSLPVNEYDEGDIAYD